MTAAYAPSAAGADPYHRAPPQLNVLQRVGGSIGTAILDRRAPARPDQGAHTPAAAAERVRPDTYVWVLLLTAVAAIPAFVLARSESAEREHALPAGVLAEAAA